jgi:hypothetical protein
MIKEKKITWDFVSRNTGRYKNSQKVEIFIPNAHRGRLDSKLLVPLPLQLQTIYVNAIQK